MKPAEIDSSIIDAFAGLFNNLSISTKLELIAKLTRSVKTDLSVRKKSFHKAFGALDTTESAEDIIEALRSSRISTRQTESF